MIKINWLGVGANRVVKCLLLVFALLGCGGGGGGSDSQDNSSDPIDNNVGDNNRQLNNIPTTNAGADLTVTEGQSVVLMGSGEDLDGDPLAYTWTQLSGLPVVLQNANSEQAVFITPSTDIDLELEFRLQVTDNRGGVSFDSIIVRVTNDEPPLANAGLDQTVDEFGLVTLDGSTSTDAEGAIQFAWKQLVGNKAALNNSTIANPTFTAPAVSVNSELIFELTVTDAIGNLSQDTVTINVNAKPVGPIPADANQFLSFLNLSSPLYQESEQSAEAYYAAVDPLNVKTTLDAWKSANGFDAGTDARAVYRNAADLGFGRVMSVRTNADGSAAAFVENYLTLEAAVNAVESNDRSELLATVAMEYSSHPNDPDGEMYIKFYTFNGNDERITKIDLDGRGEKFQPGLCVVCHGGRPKQLVNGQYPDNGNTGAQFLPWDLDTFEYSDNPLFTREALEAEFKKLNLAVLATYPDENVITQGAWSGNPSRELIHGWYGDVGAATPLAVFDEKFIPIGWRLPENGGPATNPADVEELYLNVVGPNCRACHIQRGQVFNGSTQGEFIDFISYAKFIDYRAQIIELVYDQGKMPDAKVTFENFWSEKNGLVAAEVLGAHLGIDPTIRRPGRPIANPGPPRRAPLGNVQLSGEASSFAQTFAWSFAANGGRPANSNANIINADSVTPVLVTDVPGAYQIELVVSDGVTQSEPASTTIISLNGLQQKSFSADIMPIFVNDCQSCHSVGLANSVAGIPVRFDNLASLYSSILPYINSEDIEASLIVTKPIGQQHGAGELPREGFDLSGGAAANRSNYDLLLEWIAEGALNN